MGPTNFLYWRHIELPHLTSACIGRMQRKGRTVLWWGGDWSQIRWHQKNVGLFQYANYDRNLLLTYALYPMAKCLCHLPNNLCFLGVCNILESYTLRYWCLNICQGDLLFQYANYMIKTFFYKYYISLLNVFLISKIYTCVLENVYCTYVNLTWFSFCKAYLSITKILFR
jgi:hypothetical protein